MTTVYYNKLFGNFGLLPSSTLWTSEFLLLCIFASLLQS